jgi:hypothetical protein
MPTLILTPRYTPDTQALWRAAGQLNWRVERLTGWRVTEDLLQAPEPVLYLEALIAPMVAEQFGLKLLEPPVDWLPRLPEEFRKREISLMSLATARELREPSFIKPPNDKSFPAAVYSGSELPQGYDEDSPVLVAEVVSWELEFRCFVLNRQVNTLSIYLRDGQLQSDRDYRSSEAELAAAEEFARNVLQDRRIDFPTATVLDVGIITNRGWAVIEQNAAWGSGIYGCDPVQVLEVIRHAANPIPLE